MKTCESIRKDLDGYRDGVLDAGRMAVVREHVGECEACAATLAAYEAFETRLHAVGQSWEVPRGLWARVQASVHEPAEPGTGQRSSRRWHYAWAMSAVFAAFVVFGVLQLDRQESDEMTTAMVREFHTFVVSQRALDLTSTSPTEVRHWFSDKLEFRPPTPYQERGLKLSGGRLCNIYAKRVAAYMYKVSDAWISLYIMKSQDGDLAAQSTIVDGYGHVVWNEAGLRYSLVGDVPAQRLKVIAETLRSGMTASQSSSAAPPRRQQQMTL